MKVKHIYWFAYYNLDSATTRYRAIYVLEESQRNFGIRYFFIYPSYKPGKIVQFLFYYFSALFFRKESSIIVFQKIYTNFIYSNLLRFLLLVRKRNTLYDIDDPEYLERPDDIIRWFLRHAESCSAGSPELIEYVKQFNSNVFLLTSPVFEHSVTKKQFAPVFSIGWIGCYGGAYRESLFQYCFPALRQLYFPFKLILIGVKEADHQAEIQEYFKTQPNAIIEMPQIANWHDEFSVYERIKDLDVGLSPMLDIPHHRAKSAFKIKQYFSCGVPVLASSVGENIRFLKHGKNGFFCNSIDEYKEAILKFKNMKWEEYSLLSNSARASLSDFNMEHFCRELLSHY